MFDGEIWRDLTVDRDEGPRADTSLEKLAALKPAFDPTGSVTAGNASPLNDGAAALILMAADKAKALGKKPRAYFRALRGRGRAAEHHGDRPGARGAQAARQDRNSRSIEIDLYEVNEAFASQARLLRARARACP